MNETEAVVLEDTERVRTGRGPRGAEHCRKQGARSAEPRWPWRRKGCFTRQSESHAVNSGVSGGESRPRLQTERGIADRKLSHMQSRQKEV